ncbi:hypothetical protein WT72_34010 [Burkholderia pseudomultivorans]|uniref:DUF1269 domain-containing protein n=1 Tax=Burkholderia pseudomultivorans TaxID=1207504 RepID=UPI00075897E8|nr:DUF1269 domain-containing protein [Burkholderia pseudomultivorans]KWI44193.1 hypothetical protein WT72_34010 [Burkholderia pseudomultivorans]
MSRQLIVAVFGSVDAARQAARDLDALSDRCDGFRIDNGVLVEKDATGKLAVLDVDSRPFKGGVIGAIAGGLLGLLAGPIGVVTGAAVGAGAGVLVDAAGNALLDGKFVESVAMRLALGSVALILEAKEAAPSAVDDVVAGFGGKVVRQALE